MILAHSSAVGRGQIRLLACLVVALASRCQSSSGLSDAKGVLVRQILHGSAAEITAPTKDAIGVVPDGSAGSIGMTLVFDTPQAYYRQAQDQMRRQTDTDTLRSQLNELEDAIGS